ncbi:MAG TPA: CoA transferase [Dehalococcoidia bacterium]|nr:CoA transferase [Dehalococcoidia bacterium]
MAERALDGIRVLDLTDIQAAWAAKTLADLGADVIRVEPAEGDPMRRTPPFCNGQPDPDGSLTYWFYNAGKRSIAVDIRSEVGRDEVRRLASKVDIVIESHRPGELAELGLGYEQLAAGNRGLIYVAVTPFGQDGPLAGCPATDITLCAMGGMMYVNGNPESPPLVAFGNQAYHVGSYFGAISALAALQARRRTGEGQFIDVSIEAAIAGFIEHVNVFYLFNDRVSKRQGSLHWSKGFATFRARDGYAALTMLHQWPILVPWLVSDNAADDLADERYEDLRYRADRVEHIMEVLGRWAATKTVDELFREGQERRFPWAGVYDIAQVFTVQQLHERGFWTKVQHENLGEEVIYPGAPYKMSATPWAISQRPPHHDEHRIEILAELSN